MSVEEKKKGRSIPYLQEISLALFTAGTAIEWYRYIHDNREKMKRTIKDGLYEMMEDFEKYKQERKYHEQNK